MGVTRQKFVVHTSAAGNWTDTGPAFTGIITQIRWDPDGLLAGDTGIPDTGAELKVTLEPSGTKVANYEEFTSAGDTGWTRSPRGTVHDTGGAAISGLREYIFSANERLRVRVVDTGSPSAAGNKSGTFYVWTAD